jgi:hypothetical protein
MVVRINDRQVWLENRLLALVEPILANRARRRGLLLCECFERPCGRCATDESRNFASVHWMFTIDVGDLIDLFSVTALREPCYLVSVAGLLQLLTLNGIGCRFFG